MAAETEVNVKEALQLAFDPDRLRLYDVPKVYWNWQINAALLRRHVSLVYVHSSCILLHNSHPL